MGREGPVQTCSRGILNVVTWYRRVGSEKRDKYNKNNKKNILKGQPIRPMHQPTVYKASTISQGGKTEIEEFERSPEVYLPRALSAQVREQ